MIREITFLPELTEPLGLQPATLDELGELVVLAGVEGAGKTRFLSLVKRMIEDAPRAEQEREISMRVIGELEARISAGESAAELHEQLTSERMRLAFLERLLEADAIRVDGPEGLERPSARERCVLFRYTWGDSSAPLPADRAFGGTAGAWASTDEDFVAAYRSAPAELTRIGKALFYAGHPAAEQRRDIIDAAHGADELNRLLEALVGKRLAVDLEATDDHVEPVVKLGGRRLAFDELSTGERILITWSLLLHRNRERLQGGIILIDEPELHLHPDAAIRLLSSIRSRVQGGRAQIWISTHSPSLLFYAGMRAAFLIENGAIRSMSQEGIHQFLRGNTPIEPLPIPPVDAKELRVKVGTSDFRKLRQDRAAYVDKTGFVEEVLESRAEVLLFPRPRRFGKTLNLSTLRYFVEKSDEDRSSLYDGLAVWESPTARQHFGRYPVIYLTLKDVKQDSWESCLTKMQGLVAELYGQHSYLLESNALQPQDKELYTALLYRRAAPELCEEALRILSRHLAIHHRERVVVLIDEYDTPLHAAYNPKGPGYYVQAVTFFRNFLSGGLKDNEHLFKGVLTGVLRIAKESLFSGLNNLAVYSLLRSEFATSFGFTEAEVRALTTELGDPGLMDSLRSWYNGYLFGGQVIYNPWSVVNLLASETRALRPYWVDTSDNNLLEHLLFKQGLGLRREMEQLLRGDTIRKRLEEDIALRDLDQTPDAIWSLLLFSGYLRPVEVPVLESEPVEITIPNQEVRLELEKLARSFIERHTGGGAEVQRMLGALLQGDEQTFEQYLSRFLLTSMSYLDPAGKEPERVYHAFVLGLLVTLRPEYEVESNPEAGLGRADLLVLPRQPGRPGVVLELKTVEAGETPAHAQEAALEQIREKMYTAKLDARGASPIHELAAVFDGKQVWVRRRRGS